jgi:hypothetical protein
MSGMSGTPKVGGGERGTILAYIEFVRTVCRSGMPDGSEESGTLDLVRKAPL